MTTRPYYHAAERCSCGATIDVDAYTTDDLRETLMAFRVGHRHIVNMFSRTETGAPFICTCRTDDEPGIIIDPTCPIHGGDTAPCIICGMSDDDCNGQALTTGKPCCTQCHATETHRKAKP